MLFLGFSSLLLYLKNLFCLFIYLLICSNILLCSCREDKFISQHESEYFVTGIKTIDRYAFGCILINVCYFCLFFLFDRNRVIHVEPFCVTFLRKEYGIFLDYLMNFIIVITFFWHLNYHLIFGVFVFIVLRVIIS